MPRCSSSAQGQRAQLGAADHSRALPDHLFEEPAPCLLVDGRILLLCRDNVRHTLFTTWSADGGSTWSVPRPTGIDGYPAHLLQLADGRLLCTYGRRKPPHSIRAALSADGGETWGQELVVRADLPNKDLGYPVTLADDDSLATIYYAQDETGITGIWLTRWRLG